MCSVVLAVPVNGTGLAWGTRASKAMSVTVASSELKNYVAVTAQYLLGLALADTARINAASSNAAQIQGTHRKRWSSLQL